MPSAAISRAFNEKQFVDTQANGLHSNTRVPTNWNCVGNLAKALNTSSGVWGFSELVAGPEAWRVYESALTLSGGREVTVYADALCRMVPSGRHWREGRHAAPDEGWVWRKGPEGIALGSELWADEETAYQRRRDRTDPERLEALRAQRQEERQAQLVQRREERRERLVADRAARRAAQATERAAQVAERRATQATARAAQATARTQQQAVRAVARLGQQAGGNEAAIGAAMQAVASIGRSPADGAGAAAPPPAINLASAWAYLQAHVPALIEAQDDANNANTTTCAICMDALSDTAYTACGHVATCQACTARTYDIYGDSLHQCPLCRTRGGVLQLHFG
mgnify:FL=1